MASSSFGPKRVHPAWIVLGLVRSLRAFALPLIFVLLTGGERSQAIVFLVGLGLAIVGAMLRAGQWWMLRYEVAGGELRVRSGLIARQERSVPLERIQAVDTDETPLQRVFRVVRFKVETAAGGASGSDVILEALTRADADALRAHLATARRQTATPTAPALVGEVSAAQPRFTEEEGELIKAISPVELLLAGATSGRVGPALAILFAAFQFLEDIVPDWFWDRLAMTAPEPTLRGIAALVLVLGIIAWFLAIVSTVLTFGGFTLRRAGDQLQISYGLLERRRSSIPLARVQAVTITEGILRQPFGLTALRIESAGYGQQSPTSGVLFPLIRMADLPAFLDRAYPPFVGALDNVHLRRLPRRAAPRYAFADVRGVLSFTATAVIVTTLIPVTTWWWGGFVLVLTPFAALYGLLRHHDAGWSLDTGDRLIVRSRAVARRTTVTARRRLQRRDIGSNPFQRRARLATFHTAVAAGGGGAHIAIPHMDATEAFNLMHQLGPRPRPSQRIEAESRNLQQATAHLRSG